MFKRDIEVTLVDTYRDGGTKKYRANDGTFYYEDHRLGTLTPGKIYDRYPADKGAIGEHVNLIILPNNSTPKATIA